MPGSQHHAGSLKQSNKKHKGVGGKREQKRALGAGKVSSSSSSSSQQHKDKSSNMAIEARTKRVRKNVADRKIERVDSWLQKRIGSAKGAPKVVGLIPLSMSVDVSGMLASCIAESEEPANVDAGQVPPPTYASFPHHKSRCLFLSAAFDLLSIMEVVKSCDILLFVIRASTAEDLIDETGHSILTALRAVGMPTMLCCIQGLHEFTGKSCTDIKRHATRHAESFLQQGIKVVECSPPRALGTRTPLVRSICELCPSEHAMGWRAMRSYIVANDVSIVDNVQNIPSSSVRIRGYVRGRPLSIHSLVHVAGAGTGAIHSISSFPDPHCKTHAANSTEPTIYYANGEKQDSLEVAAIPDGMSGEQTWPTEEEMMNLSSSSIEENDRLAGRDRRNIPSNIQLPAGMSDYQADWYMDEDGKFDMKGKVLDEGQEDVEGNEDDTMSMDGADEIDSGDEDMGDDEEAPQLTSLGSLATNTKAQKPSWEKSLPEDLNFVDEVDTPYNTGVTARARFARYRALQSFRSSPWNCKENLPLDYASIFQFQHFGAAQRCEMNVINKVTKNQDNSLRSLRSAHCKDVKASNRKTGNTSDMAIDAVATDTASSVLVDQTDDYIQSGQYVEIVIRGLDHTSARQQFVDSGYLTLFGMLKHENKLSVLHFNIQTAADDNQTAGVRSPCMLKGKEELIFQAGFRSFSACPVYSEGNLNCDKSKMERWVQPGRPTVATVYAPITYLPCPVLVFRRISNDSGSSLKLVATGSLDSVDPDRIILKKVILTGIPIRVRKRFAVVKHMFYDTNDVRWFKPAELYTRHGLRGNIREAVGTHGLLKAIFSGPITQNDTVMLVLFKRVFPKHSKDMLNCTLIENGDNNAAADDVMEEVE